MRQPHPDESLSALLSRESRLDRALLDGEPPLFELPAIVPPLERDRLLLDSAAAEFVPPPPEPPAADVVPPWPP